MHRPASVPTLFCSALALLALMGCAASTAPTPFAGKGNPASVYCVQRGGKLEIARDASGERGLCQLPDGTVIDEWALFRRDRARP